MLLQEKASDMIVWKITPWAVFDLCRLHLIGLFMAAVALEKVVVTWLLSFCVVFEILSILLVNL